MTAPPELEAFDRFCRALTLEQGRPLALEPFQRSMLAEHFAGARETLILLPKKNGKTTLLAALGLFHLCTTPNAEGVVGATSRDQATILFDQARGFVSRSAGLQQRVVVKRGYREIRSLRDAGRLRVLAADVDTADGVIPTLALVDELHRARSAELYGVFRDGLGPRDGRMIAISPAGDHEQSPLGLMRAAARKLPVQERADRYLVSRSPDFVMHEWALERDDDVADMAVVKRANPASWQTPEELARRHDSPSMLPWQWARFACGLWVGAEAWWLNAEAWAAAERDAHLEPGDEVTIGFDGSRYGDATALVACRIEDGLVEPLGVWEQPAGGGPREWEVPTGEVDAALAEAMGRYKVRRGYFDPPLWQSEIDSWAREYGEPAVMRYPTNRSRMKDAVERFRTDLAAGGPPFHTGDELLTGHALNAQVKEVRGGYFLTKSRPGSPDKIDAAVAAVLAYEARADHLASGPVEYEPAELIAF